VSAAELVQLCAFGVGAEEYAIDILRVEEVLAAPPVTPLRGAPRFLEGVLELRGVILPIIDVRKRMGVPASPGRGGARLIVCKVGPRRLGLVVDRLTQVFRVERSTLKPAPVGARDGEAPWVLGVCQQGHRLVFLLDVKALLQEREG
jgi:purine-binding chemotaxis protein CheW